MFYSNGEVEFRFEDGEVTILKDNENIETRYIGFDTCEKDFVKWCEYYLEEELNI